MALAAVCAFAVIAPVALGGDSASYPKSANLKQGKILFVAACGGCHTLAPAGTKGKKGPNLAEEPSAFAAVVSQITYGGEGMPAFGKGFTRAQIRNIAAYVAKSTPYSGARDD